MLNFKINKKYFHKKLQNKIVQKRLKISSLFLMGFLLGLVFKVQASQTILIGYEDYKILKSNENLIENKTIQLNNKQ